MPGDDAMKTFAQKLSDLVDDELTFPGNPDAAVDHVIECLERQAIALTEEAALDRLMRKTKKGAARG
jgi:hypothetical protein